MHILFHSTFSAAKTQRRRFLFFWLTATAALVLFPAFGRAGWDFRLADESRITIHIQNLDPRDEEKVITFLPPVTGNPLEIQESEDGRAQAIYPLRGRVTPDVIRLSVHNQNLVTSNRYFVIPIVFEDNNKVTLVFDAEKNDGAVLRYAVTVTFIPPESIYSQYYFDQQDILKTIFNFQFALSAIHINTGPPADSSIFVFPVLGGYLTVEPKFFKWAYISGCINMSLFKKPSSTVEDVGYSMFQGQVMGRYFFNLGPTFRLTPEIGLTYRTQHFSQHVNVKRIGVSVFQTWGIIAAIHLVPNEHWYGRFRFTYFLPVTDTLAGSRVQSYELALQLGMSVSESLKIGLGYALQFYKVSRAFSFSEQSNHFLLLVGSHF